MQQYETAGSALIERLKTHVIDSMKPNEECSPTGRGLGNIDIETVAGLALNLDAQDHYLTYSILHALIRDGRVEQMRWPVAPKRPKYRLTGA